MSIYRKSVSLLNLIDDNFLDKPLERLSANRNYINGRCYTVNRDDENAMKRVKYEYKRISICTRFIYGILPVCIIFALMVMVLGINRENNQLKQIGLGCSILLAIIYLIVMCIIKGKIRNAFCDYVNNLRKTEALRIEANAEYVRFMRLDLLRNCPNCGANRLEDEKNCVYCGSSLYTKFSSLQKSKE